MPLTRFLCCFNIYEGSWICGVCSLCMGALRVYLQWFNIEFRHRLSKKQREALLIDFGEIQLVAKLQLSVAALAMSVSLVLLYGLCKSKRWFLCPWMIWVAFEELFSFCVIIFFGVSGVKLTFPVYLFEAINFFVSVYCLLCVYSFFSHLKFEDELKKNISNIQVAFDAEDFDDDQELRPLIQDNKPM